MSSPELEKSTAIPAPSTGLLEVTGIYNRHATATNARESTAMIEPDSIVYIEGLNIETDYDSSNGSYISDILYDLAIDKRTNGKDKTYEETKLAIISRLRDQLTEVQNRGLVARLRSYVSEPFEFHEHELTLAIELLKKDCEIIPADYRHPSNSTDPEYWNTVSQRVDDILNASEFKLFRKVSSSSDTSEYLQQLRNIVVQEQILHYLREHSAAARITIDAQHIKEDSARFDNAPKTSAGRVRSYLVYGTSHARSLTKVLQKSGIDTTPFEINQIEEHQYLDSIEVLEGEVVRFPNFYRRLSHTALSALNQTIHIRPDRNKGEMANAYLALEEMNGDKEKALGFCTDCLKIKQKHSRNLIGAHRDFRRLLDSLHQ
jgi:hypothetical protein